MGQVGTSWNKGAPCVCEKAHSHGIGLNVWLTWKWSRPFLANKTDHDVNSIAHLEQMKKWGVPVTHSVPLGACCLWLSLGLCGEILVPVAPLALLMCHNFCVKLSALGSPTFFYFAQTTWSSWPTTHQPRRMEGLSFNILQHHQTKVEQQS